MSSSLSLARRVPRALLGFRGRAFAFGGLLGAVAVVVPREHGVPAFLLGPCGPGLAALAILLVASFIEEAGKLSRIRQASRWRLGALLFLVAALVWGLSIHDSANVLFGLGLAAAASLFVLPAALYDVATLRDTRLGEPVWYERLGDDGLELASLRGSLLVRYDTVLHVAPGGSTEEHGVLVTVRAGAARSPQVSLRWLESTRDGDRFFLAERQADADAADFALRLEAARTRRGYR